MAEIKTRQATAWGKRAMFGLLAVSAALPVATAAGAADIPHGLAPSAALTPIGMFLGADAVVKGIILTLLAASVMTWTVLIAKCIEIRVAKRRLKRDLAVLKASLFLTEALSGAQARRGLVTRLLAEARDELRAALPGCDKDAVQWRAVSRLDDLEAEAARAMRFGTGILATIGSTAPFVGLLGTVWGIMNSFVGIAASHTTNLAVVAPGIAEALLATAVGLIAAIPAVVIYNGFTRSIAGYRALVRLCSAEIARMISRELERQQAPATGRFRVAAE